MKRVIAFLTNIFMTLSSTTLLCAATEAVEETTQNEYLAHAEKMLTEVQKDEIIRLTCCHRLDAYASAKSA